MTSSLDSEPVSVLVLESAPSWPSVHQLSLATDLHSADPSFLIQSDWSVLKSPSSPMQASSPSLLVLFLECDALLACGSPMPVVGVLRLDSHLESEQTTGTARTVASDVAFASLTELAPSASSTPPGWPPPWEQRCGNRS